MDSGLYTSAVGMLTEFNSENSVSDNLANMQTPGYKERTPVQEDFTQILVNSQQGTEAGLPMASLADYAGPAGAPSNPMELARMGVGHFGSAPQIQDYGLNLAQGSARYTGSSHDLMIVGNGFFQARSGSGTLLTRNGSFHRSAQGLLMTAEGYPVLGQGGRPLKVPSGTLEIDKGGELRVDGRRVGRLALATVPQGQPLTETGNGYYRGPGQPLTGRASADVGVLQGYLEGSNVDLSTQMSSMLSAQRAYQANSQMLQAQDTTMGLAVNDLGKVSG